MIIINNLNVKIMSLLGNLETNSLGGGGFGFGGFGGGIPPVGLFGVIGGGHRDHGHGYHKDCDSSLFTLNAIGNLKDTIQNAKDSLNEQIDSARDNLDSRIDSVKDQISAESRALDKDICDLKTNVLTGFYETRGDVKDGFYASAIQAERNTTEIKNQAQAFQIANDRKFDELSREGERNTALILAKLNQDKIDDLREELHGERRRGDSREIEINIANTNTNVLTAIQSIRTETDRKFELLFGSFNQLNRNTQDVINFGTMAASANQANQQTAIK